MTGDLTRAGAAAFAVTAFQLRDRQHANAPPSLCSPPAVRFRFPPDVIALAVRWPLRFGLSYRHVQELLARRAVQVDHLTIYRWAAVHAATATPPGRATTGPATAGVSMRRR